MHGGIRLPEVSSGDALLYVLTVDGLASPERTRGSQEARKGGTDKREVATSRCGGNREIAAEIGKSERTVKTLTIALQEKNILRRVNGKRNGYWEFVEDSIQQGSNIDKK